MAILKIEATKKEENTTQFHPRKRVGKTRKDKATGAWAARFQNQQFRASETYKKEVLERGKITSRKGSWKKIKVSVTQAVMDSPSSKSVKKK